VQDEQGAECYRQGRANCVGQTCVLLIVEVIVRFEQEAVVIITFTFHLCVD